MAEYTENLNLILPKQTEGYDVEVANTNNKAIDAAIGNKVNKVPGKDLSTNDFTNGYKQKIDSMQRLYKFKGSISTYDDLSEIEQTAVGDVYNVLDTNNNYCWDGIQWVELGIHIDLSEYENQLKELETKQNEKIEESKAEIEKIKQDIQNGTGTGGGGGDSEEIGSVKMWFSNTIPANWLLLNGQEVSRTEYSELFAIISTTYGAGDGSTTFNLPDMRGYVPVGLKSDDDTFNVLGKKVGEKKHKMTLAELIEHYHKYGEGDGNMLHGGRTGEPAKLLSNTGDDYRWTNYPDTQSTGEGQPFNIIQPSICTNFIIKAKQEKTVQKDLTLSEILAEVIKQENEEATETNVYSAKAIDDKLAKESRLVAEVILEEASNVMEITTNLDIVRDGGVYDIVIAEYDTANSGAGHVLQINNKTEKYVNTHKYTNSNNVMLVGNGSNCLAYTNGFNVGSALFYTIGTLTFFNKDWINFESSGGSSNADGTNKISISQSGQALQMKIDTINSIRVVANEGTFIGPGSFMKVYKRSGTSGDIVDVNGLSSFKRKVLWQNSASTSQFDSQTIKLSDDDFDELEIIYKIVASNSFMLNIKIPKGMQTYLTSDMVDNSQVNVYQRIFSYVDAVTYQVGDCHKMVGANYQGIDNNRVIPYQVIGYKY